MKKSIILIIVGCMIALLALTVSLFMVPPPGLAWVNHSLATGLASASAITHITAAILLATSLEVYKPRVRRAYVFFALGITSLAISTIQMPIISFFGLWATPYITWGIVNIPMIAYGFLCYYGATILARIFGVQGVLASFWTIPLSLIAALSSIFIVKARFPQSEIGFYFLIVTVVWCGLFNAITTILSFRVKRHIGAHYTPTMSWLARATSLSFVITVVIAINNLFVGADNQTLVNTFVYILGVASGCLWLCTGYSFIEAEEL